METVLAIDESLARNVVEHLPDGEVDHYNGAAEDIPDAVIAIEGPRRFVENCQGAMVVVVGVRLGMTRYLAMDGVRELLRPGATPRPPAVILVAQRITIQLAKHANELGVFSIVETQRSDRMRLSRIIADEILLARAWREGRAERASFVPTSRARRLPAKCAPAIRAKKKPS